MSAGKRNKIDPYVLFENKEFLDKLNWKLDDIISNSRLKWNWETIANSSVKPLGIIHIVKATINDLVYYFISNNRV